MGGAFDLVAGSQAIFRAVLDAMARPGRLGRLPVADARCPVAGCAPLAALLLTLLDHEVTFAVVPAAGDHALADRLSDYLTVVTGSRPAPLDRADYVVALGGLAPGCLERLKRGTLTYPDASATLLILVPSLTAGRGLPAALAGPGVPSETVVQLAGLTPADLVALAEVNAEFPLGVDVVLVDAAGAVVGLPRSTRVVVR